MHFVHCVTNNGTDSYLSEVMPENLKLSSTYRKLQEVFLLVSQNIKLNDLNFAQTVIFICVFVLLLHFALTMLSICIPPQPPVNFIPVVQRESTPDASASELGARNSCKSSCLSLRRFDAGESL